MSISSVSAISPSQSSPIIHAGRGYFSTLSKVQWLAAACFAVLAIALYRYLTAKRTSTPAPHRPLPAPNPHVAEEGAQNKETTNEVSTKSSSTFEDCLYRYQRCDKMLEVLEYLEGQLEKRSTENENEISTLVQFLSKQCPIFANLISTMIKEEDQNLKELFLNGTIISKEKITPTLESQKKIISSTKKSLEKTKELLRKDLSDKIPSDKVDKIISADSNDNFLNIVFGESVKPLQPSMKEKTLYPASIFDSLRKESPNCSDPSLDFKDWKHMIIVRDAFDPESKEVFVLNTELPSIDEMEDCKVTKYSLLARFFADDKTIHQLLHSKT